VAGTAPADRRDLRLAVVLVVAIVASLGVVTLMDRGTPPPGPRVFTLDERRAIAKQTCRETLRKRLHDSGSAETVEEVVRDLPDGSFVYAARLRAKNAFGALRLTTIACTTDRDGLAVTALETVQ
jgi:hypothetical protein